MTDEGHFSRDRAHLGGGEADLPGPTARAALARPILARVLRGRSTLARAAVALGMPLEELPSVRTERRLAIYRAYVGTVVQTASPLVFRICAMHGKSLDDLVAQLRPGMVWDQWLCGERPGDAWLRSVSGQVNARAPDHMRDEWALQVWLHSGLTVWCPVDLRAIFGLRVLDAGLEMAAFPGGHRLRTHGTEGSITLRMELPATIMAALPGMALDRLIDHPLINGAGCVVTGVDEPHPRWGTKVRFALDQVPWRMPWAR